MMIGRFFVAVAFCIGAALPVSADVQTILKHKHWQVFYMTDPGRSAVCVASVFVSDKVHFSIGSNGSGPLRMTMVDNRFKETRRAKTVSVNYQIDKQRPWVNTNVAFKGNSVSWEMPNNQENAQFMAEIIAGQDLLVWADWAQYDYRFSLRGSQAAMQALISCISKI